MVCKKCGNAIRDNAKFCPHCGALNSPDAGGRAVPSPAAPTWEKPEGGKKKTGLIIGGVAAAVAVIALLAVVVSGVFSSPKERVEKAFLKSLAACARAKDALGLPDLDRLAEERSVSRRLSLRLIRLDTTMAGYDLSALEGLGLSVRGDLDITGRELGMELAASWDDRELLSVLLAADDSQVCLASPQITGEDFYGVNTETLGADLARLTSDDSVKDLSFNFFELVELALDWTDTATLKQGLKDAAKTLWQDTAVKKTGARTLGLNGAGVRTTAYQITVPEAALMRYAADLERVLSNMDYAGLYEELFRRLGMPEDAVNDFVDGLDGLDVYSELVNGLKDRIDGDLELDVCLSGGYVSAVVYGDHAADSGVRLAVYLGGGKEYVDNLRLEADMGGRKVVIDSSGDHGCRSGVFTDETTIRGPFSTVVSELRYEPGGTRDNFSWAVNIPGSGSLEMAGRLTCGEASVDLHLNKLALKALGVEVASVEMDYRVGPYEGRSVAVRAPKLIGEMDGLELMLAALKLRTNAQTWMEDMRALFDSRLPAGVF